ncbi:MAG: ankyrin repeat domain-containing protein [Pirellulales bacterium]
MLSEALQGGPPAKDRVVAVGGTIHATHRPLKSPFGGLDCVLCEYDLLSKKPTGGDGPPGSDYAGFLMCPCEIRGGQGTIRVLGFPIYDAPEVRESSWEAALCAREFFRTHEFEDRSGVKMLSTLAVFGEIWADDDGAVEKNMRLGKRTYDDLFPPHFDAEMERLKAKYGSTFDAEDDADEDDLDDEDSDDDRNQNDESDESDLDRDDGTPGYEIPGMKEKRILDGESVVVIGVYDEMRGGLVPPGRGGPPNRLFRDTLEARREKASRAVVSNLLGGLFGLVAIHAVIFGVMWVFLHSDATLRDRSRRMTNAVAKPDLTEIDDLLRRGFDVNTRDHQGRTPLLHADDDAVIVKLLEYQADPNVADEYGRTPLMNSASRGRSAGVERLLAAGAEIDARDRRGRTALNLAIENGQIAARDVLRIHGARESEPPAPRD